MKESAPHVKKKQRALLDLTALITNNATDAGIS